MPQGSFGSFLFGKVFGRWATFHDYTRNEDARYLDHMVHLSKPKSEYGGPGLIQLDLKMVLLTTWSGDIRPIISQLQTYQRNGLAATLLLGGKPAGPRQSAFILESLNEHYTHWLGDGTPIRVELKLSFVEYQPQVAATYL